jgi:hypothetical protein
LFQDDCGVRWPLSVVAVWGYWAIPDDAAEARKLVDAVLSANQKKLAKLVIESNGEHDGCVVYHAYQSPGTMTFTVGWWSIDTRTAEVWDDLIRERITNSRLAPVQLTIRKRLGVT